MLKASLHVGLLILIFGGAVNALRQGTSWQGLYR
jgi:hypothetical protein